MATVCGFYHPWVAESQFSSIHMVISLDTATINNEWQP